MEHTKRFNDGVAKAEVDVAMMDKTDGFADRHIRTIFGALECGLNEKPGSGSTNALFDAYVMLRDVATLQRNILAEIDWLILCAVRDSYHLSHMSPKELEEWFIATLKTRRARGASNEASST